MNTLGEKNLTEPSGFFISEHLIIVEYAILVLGKLSLHL
jgi:hypothetical protein